MHSSHRATILNATTVGKTANRHDDSPQRSQQHRRRSRVSAAVSGRRVKWIDRGSSRRVDLPGRAIYDPNGAAAIIAFVVFGLFAVGLWTSECAVPPVHTHSPLARVLPDPASGKMDTLRLPGEHIHVDRFHLPFQPEKWY
jgi:hypothetical protein